MADPLSIAASVAGLLAVSSKVIFGLSTFASAIMHTPKSLQRVVAEVGAVNCILGEVQKLIAWQSDAERPTNPSLGLVQLNHLVTTLTGCVLVFSELEKHIDDLVGAESGSKPRIVWERISWTRKENEIGKLMDDLHQHKTSLSLMLTIIQCTNQVEAVGCTKQLCSIMVDILESNRVISTQLRAVMARQGIADPPDDAVSVRTGRSAVSARSVPAAAQRPFERVLRKSKVYKYERLWNMSMSSSGSLLTASTGQTSISTASLSEVPNILDIALPLRPQTLRNAEHYLEGGNTASAAGSVDDPRGFFAALDQQKSNGSLRPSPVGARQLNPVPAAFLNTILNRAFYGSFGNIGPVFVKGYIKMMPYHQLVLSARLPLKVLLNEYKRGNQERAKLMFRAWTGIGEWLLETQNEKIIRGAVDQYIADFNNLLDRGEVQEAKYYFLLGTEAVVRVVEVDNKLGASLVVDAVVRGLENTLTHPYIAQFAAMIEDTFHKINLSTTVWGWIECRATAIGALLSVQLAARLGKNNVLDFLVEALSAVQKRLSLSRHPHAWLTMVLGWEGDSWLLEVSVATAAMLLEYEREGVKVFAGLVIDGLEWILKVATSANRLSEVLTLIDEFTGGLSEGASSDPVVPYGGQEGTVMGATMGEGIQYASGASGVGSSDVERALGKVLAALSRMYLGVEKPVGEA